MKLSEEIRAIGSSDNGQEYAEGVMHGLYMAAQLAEKREAEQPDLTAAVLEIVDACFRCFASSYRAEAAEYAQDLITAKLQPPESEVM